MPSSDAVSVVIPHFDDLSNLVACVSALAKQTQKADEIIVVDNGSPCGLQAIESALKPTGASWVLIQERERGAAPARNAGVRASHGNILAFADSDVRPAPDWLDRGRRAVASAPIVGGRVDVVPHNRRCPSTIELWDMVFGFDVATFLKRAGHFLTANLLVRRSVFETVGPFRNGVPEDLEWCHRATKAGYSLTYDPELAVEHPAMARWGPLAARWRRLTTEQYRFAREQRFGCFLFWARSLAVLASVVPHAGKVLVSKRVAFAKKGGVIAILARVRFLRFFEAQRLAFGGSTKINPLVLR